MADNYNDIVIIDDNGSSGEEQKTYTEIFGYVFDENYNPVCSEIGKNPIIVKLNNNLEYELATTDNYFKFDEQDVTTLSEGVITVFDGNEDTVFNWNAASHAFTGAAKTRLNIKIIMPYKRINMGDVTGDELNDRPITITITNGPEIAGRLIITAKDGNENDLNEFSYNRIGDTITCTIQYGHMIRFSDPNGEYYDYTLTINTTGEDTYNVHLTESVPEASITINVHIYDKDNNEDITPSSWVSIDGADQTYGASTFIVTQYSTIIANNSEYLSDYRIIESPDSTQDITFTLKKQASAGSHTNEEWHEVYLGIPWYVDKIDLKYTAVDIYSSKKAQLTHDKINILPFTDTNCVGQYDGNVVMSDGNTRKSKLNNLNYVRNVNINENIYQFLFELKKENYPIDFLEAADKDTKTLELHTFEPTSIKVKQRKMNGSVPNYINYNPENGDPYIRTDADNIIGGFIDVTYDGGSQDANSIISAQYISGDGDPWNTVGLTSSEMATLNDVYLQPVINNANSAIDNINDGEKLDYINRLSILYNSIICHKESYTFPYLLDGSLTPVELIYGQKNKNINVGPLKYEFKQDEEAGIIYSLQAAGNEKYIPKFKIDEISLDGRRLDNYTTEINNEYLKINTTNPIRVENDSTTLNISYHMNDDTPTNDQVISVGCSVVSSPEVILTGYTFNNVDNYNFKYITDADVSVTENYFSGASSVNAASQYSFILYSKSPGDTPENLLTAVIESQTGAISENELTVHNNVSLSASDGSDITYTLTSLSGVGNWTDYSSTINNADNNILGTYYTKSSGRFLIKTKISYSYINDIITTDDLTCSYKLNNNEYIYNVKAIDDKYSGKYYLYGNNETFSELSIFGRWNESGENYKYTTTSGLPDINSNIINISCNENDIKSLTASMYNLHSDGTTFIAPNIITNTNKIVLLTNEDNSNNELLKQQDIISEIKSQMNAALKHNYIVLTNNEGTNYTSTLLYQKLSSANSELYVGPTVNIISGSNRYTLNYTDFLRSETLTQEKDTLITNLADVSIDDSNNDYISNYKYDWDNFDEITISSELLEKYYTLFNSNNLSYTKIRNTGGNIKNQYDNYIYKYDKLKYGDETSTDDYYNSQFVIYTSAANSVPYNNFAQYVNTYKTDPTWCETVGYTVAKSYILGFAYSYLYNLQKYENSNNYKVAPINLTNTELYSYTIQGNNVNIITSTSTTYSILLSTNGNNIDDGNRRNGIEIFKSSSNLVEEELSDFTEYNNGILSYVNAAFIYNNSNTAITLNQMYNIFENTNINITGDNTNVNLQDYLVLDKKLRALNLKLKSDNGNYADQIINYAFAMHDAAITFYPKLENGIKLYKAKSTTNNIEVYERTRDSASIVKSFLDNCRINNEQNTKYWYEVSTKHYELMWSRTRDVGDPPTQQVYYGYGNSNEITNFNINKVYEIKSGTGNTYSLNNGTVQDLSKPALNNLFILLNSCNLGSSGSLNGTIDYLYALNNGLLPILNDMGLKLDAVPQDGVIEKIEFNTAIYDTFITWRNLYEEAISISYDSSMNTRYYNQILNYVKNISGTNEAGYTTSSSNIDNKYLYNKLLYGLAYQCYNLIELAIPVFTTYKKNISSCVSLFTTARNNKLTLIKNNTPKSLEFDVIKSFNDIKYINEESRGISKFYDVYNEIQYLQDFGKKLMISNYLKRAMAFSKGSGESMDNYKTQLSNEITKEKLLSEIEFVNKWITNRLMLYGKNNNTDRIQWGSDATNKLTFNPDWINLITDNEYSINTIYCNGYNIYKLNNDIYENEHITQYPGLHLRYVINESISEITANTDVYSMTDIKKFRGTIYQTCEELKKRTNNVLHLLLYYYDGFIKEIKVTNNILNNAYKVNNIGCVYEEVNEYLLITFDATGISEDNIDTNKFVPSIEVEYCHTEETEYTSKTVTNNSGFYVNIPLSDNKLCHIRYRMKWSSSTGISIYSEYNNIVYFYNPNDDGYSYKSLEFNSQAGPSTQDIKTILNNALELQLFAKRTTNNSEINTYYVADYRSSVSNKNIGFKFITKVNGDDQIVTPKLSENYTNYSLSIIDLDNIGNHFIPGTLPGVNSITTNKKYVLTKGE